MGYFATLKPKQTILFFKILKEMIKDSSKSLRQIAENVETTHITVDRIIKGYIDPITIEKTILVNPETLGLEVYLFKVKGDAKRYLEREEIVRNIFYSVDENIYYAIVVGEYHEVRRLELLLNNTASIESVSKERLSVLKVSQFVPLSFIDNRIKELEEVIEDGN